MSSYQSQLANLNYIPNIVILFMGEYFSIRQPDSGLVVDSDKVGSVSDCNINPTAIDPFRPSSVINNFSFKLLDIRESVTKLYAGQTGYLLREPVQIWIGRCNGATSPNAMDFSEYYQLPPTRTQRINKVDQGYTIQCIENRDKLNSGKFQNQSILAVDILAATTTITLVDASVFPSSGYVQIENEFISYTSIVGNNLTGCIRGEFGSTPADHASMTSVLMAVPLSGNPIDLLLQCLISKGGGGPYDVLPDGGGIDQTLVDVTQMQQIRDEFFTSYNFFLIISNVSSLRSFLEDEILFPLGIRLRSNLNGKIGLALLDRRIFDIDTPVINHDTMTKDPQYDTDDTKIVNAIQVSWDWDDATQSFNQISLFSDADSVADWGQTTLQTYEFKGPRTSLGGAAVVNSFQKLFFARFAQPKPIVSVNVQMSSSYSELGDKVDLITTRIPNTDGELNFASTLEITQKAINYKTGDVKYQLSFNAFTGIRSCYIAPSDTAVAHSGNSITVGAGRGVYWRAGWFCALYDNTTRDYAGVQDNEILSVVGDVVTFVDPWSIPIVNGRHRIMFSDYSVVTPQQQKYCFVCQNLGNFPDGTSPYKILFGGG